MRILRLHWALTDSSSLTLEHPCPLSVACNWATKIILSETACFRRKWSRQWTFSTRRSAREISTKSRVELAAPWCLRSPRNERKLPLKILLRAGIILWVKGSWHSSNHRLVRYLSVRKWVAVVVWEWSMANFLSPDSNHTTFNLGAVSKAAPPQSLQTSKVS